MYIEIHNYYELEQKALYFKLNNAFNMSYATEENIKIVGIYAIYSNNTCLYVGQSKNIASRIATHLRGKYQNSTDIYIWDIEELGFADFKKRDQKSREQILNNAEKHIMSILKPIDNIDIDMDIKIKEDEQPVFKIDNNSTFSVHIDSEYLKICDDSLMFLVEIGVSIDFLHYQGKIDTKTRAIVLKSILETSPTSFCKKEQI